MTFAELIDAYEAADGLFIDVEQPEIDPQPGMIGWCFWNFNDDDQFSDYSWSQCVNREVFVRFRERRGNPLARKNYKNYTTHEFKREQIAVLRQICLPDIQAEALLRGRLRKIIDAWKALQKAESAV